MPEHPSYHRVPLLVAAAACWGIGTVITKQVLDDGVKPLTLLPIQLGASCILLLAVAAATQRRPRSGSAEARRRTPSPEFKQLAALGVLNPGIAYALGLLGLQTITASMSVLLWAAEPALILLLAIVILRERVGGALVAFLAAALVGVALVVYQPGATGDVVGIALTTAGVGACAIYTVLTRRLLLDDASLIVVLVQQAAALTFALTLAVAVRLVTSDAWDLGSLSATTWALAALSGVLYYAFAFWFYLAGLRQVPASVAGAFLPLIPVFGVAAAYVVGERLAERQWLGAAIVVVATAFSALRSRTLRPVVST